jgi:hypothetical protein
MVKDTILEKSGLKTSKGIKQERLFEAQYPLI